MLFTTSSIETQLMCWYLFPIIIPKPDLKGPSNFCKIPPFGVNTTPKRVLTTLMPISVASFVAFSHFWHTSERNPSPGLLSSVNGSLGLFPP